ncbi:MAG: GAF domain-containing protein [Candidatus Thiodiazotropha sp.]
MKTSTTAISERKLLRAITNVLSQYISETNPHILFNGLLDTLLDVTSSEYGFIGQVLYDVDGKPYIRNYATSNISWSEETKRLYEESMCKGMIFSRLDSLYGAVLKTGQPVISNQPSTNSRSCGLPLGHPPLRSFLGLPFYADGKLLGMVGIANRKDGYQTELADSLSPFLMACGSLVVVYQNNIQQISLTQQLHKYKEHLAELNDSFPLGGEYEFNHSLLTILKNGQPVLLTKKEQKLLEILVANKNMPVQHERILEHVWPNIIVGEASIRALVHRLRQKLPGLIIQTVSGVGYILKVD